MVVPARAASSPIRMDSTVILDADVRATRSRAVAEASVRKITLKQLGVDAIPAYDDR